jgi:hypothetical protein
LRLRTTMGGRFCGFFVATNFNVANVLMSVSFLEC